MAREVKRLTARTVSSLKEPGRYADGGGLYLQIGPTGTKAWLFLFKRDGKRREMGLGAIGDVSLAEARQKAEEARRIAAESGDPFEVRKAAKDARREADAAPTFGGFADVLIAGIEGGFRNEKHIYQWKQTLGPAYCARIRDKKIADISTDDVLAILQPIWLEKNETASRLRGRIERVLDAAKAKGLRSGENPARWRGHLDTLLSKRQKLQRGHHPAMPYAEVPAFIADLQKREAMAARALEFAILTAARSGEVLGATWAEVDLKAKVWSIPAARMKARRDHRVPLPEPALAVLDAVAPLRRADDDGSGFLFPGQRPMRPLSGMAMEMLLRRQKLDITVHGFRSSFRDWAAEETAFPREIAEAALAHVVGDTTERAYRRGDALEKRRELMKAWAAFCLR
ncbi:MAG TPA: integrase arm-type DNA-binding domain-containing protein [Xanthobacteraceae bacterium]|jgi:integrase|nr:integrase arm-type DNA-binding domain-containing protein [Xanthobacteraceae bacterium]